MQIDVWLAGFESDEKIIFARLNSSGDLDLDAPDEVVKALGLTAKFTSCFGPFSSILKHLVLLPQNPFLRYVPVLSSLLTLCSPWTQNEIHAHY